MICIAVLQVAKPLDTLYETALLTLCGKWTVVLGNLSCFMNSHALSYKHHLVLHLSNYNLDLKHLQKLNLHAFISGQ